jgi:hypothetical protein
MNEKFNPEMGSWHERIILYEQENPTLNKNSTNK